MLILNEAKPKYEKLDSLFEEKIFQNIKFSNNVTIIIDLKEICRKFYRPDIELYNSSYLVEEISSDILNTIAHYRNYFYKKGKYTEFYILYSFEKCKEIIDEIPNYKEDYYKEYMDETNPKYDIMKRAVLATRKVSDRLPKVSFIETSKYDEFAYAKYITNLRLKNEAIVILSNDDVFYQLVKDNIFILTIKGIKSELISSDNVIEVLTGKDDYKFSSKMIPLILALSGTKRYSYIGLPNVALVKAANIVKKLIETEKLIDADSVRFPLDKDQLDENSKMEKMIIDNFKTIEDNYYYIKADNLVYQHNLDIKNDVIVKRIIAKPEALRALNERIYVRFPLNLDMLIKGEKI
jgi:hypothetical protein